MGYWSSRIGSGRGRAGIALTCVALFAVLWLPESFADEQSRDRAIVRTAPEPGGGLKVALVIGNKDYQRAPLQNPLNDAEAVTQVLTRLGFSVTIKTNVNQQELEEAIERFSRRIEDAQAALLYFSGHGCQVGGENYLVPVGYNFQSDADLRYKAVNAGHVLARMEQARSKVNIIILDACRDNPFKGVRTASRGLAALEAPSGTFIAYATAPGKVASDTPREKNSVYTKHLLSAMETHGLTIEQAFKKVSKGVNTDTNGLQVPWTSSSLVSDFCFNPELVVPGSPTIPASAVPPARPSDDKRDETESLRKLADAGDPKAQFELGLKYEFGLGVPRDLERAKKMYYMAARQGEKLALEALARLAPPIPTPVPHPTPSVGPPSVPQKASSQTAAPSRPPARPAKRDPSKDAPLMDAAKEGDVAEVERLLSRGADINARNQDRTTVLHFAARFANAGTVQLLLERGAQINAKDNDQETPLHGAIRYGNLETMKLLLERGADVNARDGERQTALHWGVSSGNKEIVELLLERGADVSAKDAKGETALDLAGTDNLAEIATILKEHSGSPKKK